MTTIRQLGEPATKTILAQNAETIRALGKRVIGDIIEIGRLLTEAKQIVGHGNCGWIASSAGPTTLPSDRRRSRRSCRAISH
jgi:hypothetical protein